MPGEADRLRKHLQGIQGVAIDETRRRKRAEERAADLERQNEILAERVHHLEAKKDELERQNATLAGRSPLERQEGPGGVGAMMAAYGPVTYVDTDQQAWDRVRGRLSKLENEVMGLEAAQRDLFSRMARLERVEEPLPERRWWWK